MICLENLNDVKHKLYTKWRDTWPTNDSSYFILYFKFLYNVEIRNFKYLEQLFHILGLTI